MPFTFAHPLYAAPLKVIKPAVVSLTGIILGSMSPDFEYFIALEPFQTIGHSTLGLVLQAIPLSIVFAFLFHYLVKGALADQLPAMWDMNGRAQQLIRSHPWRMNRMMDWIVFVMSVVIGFYLHVLTDSFTHAHGYFVLRSSILQAEALGFPVYKILQHGLSLLGLLIEGLFIIILFNRTKPTVQTHHLSTRNKSIFWLIAIAVALVTVVLKFSLTSSTNIIGIGIVSLLSGCMVGVVISSIIYRIQKWGNV